MMVAKGIALCYHGGLASFSLSLSLSLYVPFSVSVSVSVPVSWNEFGPRCFRGGWMDIISASLETSNDLVSFPQTIAFKEIITSVWKIL